MVAVGKTDSVFLFRKVGYKAYVLRLKQEKNKKKEQRYIQLKVLMVKEKDPETSRVIKKNEQIIDPGKTKSM